MSCFLYVHVCRFYSCVRVCGHWRSFLQTWAQRSSGAYHAATTHRPVAHGFVHRRCGDSRSSACTINTVLSLPMAGQREELYSLKTATVPYCYAHPEIIVVDQQLLQYFIETSSVEYRVPTTLRNLTVTNIKVSSINIDMTIDDMPTWCTPACPPLSSDL